MHSLEEILKKYFSITKTLKRKEEKKGKEKRREEIGKEVDVLYYILEAYAILGNEEKIKELKRLKQIFQ